MKSKTSLVRLPLLLALALPVATWAYGGDVTDVPGVEDGPALSGDASKVLGLGFADLHGVSGVNAGAGADSDAITLSEEGADGKMIRLTMDPISGELKQR